MGAPIGSVVSLYIDTTRQVLVNEFIRTQTGRTYQIVSVRTQQRGKHAGRRQHLRALVVPATTPTEDDTVIPILWYPRTKAGR
jgi:hypothetical protein